MTDDADVARPQLFFGLIIWVRDHDLRCGGADVSPARRRVGGCRKGEGVERASRFALARRMAPSPRITGLCSVLGTTTDSYSERRERAVRSLWRMCAWIVMA